MIKAHIALHKSPDGKLTVLAASEDADQARNAYRSSTAAGEIALGRVTLEKSKKQAGQPDEAKPAAKTGKKTS